MNAEVEQSIRERRKIIIRIKHAAVRSIDLTVGSEKPFGVCQYGTRTVTINTVGK